MFGVFGKVLSTLAVETVAQVGRGWGLVTLVARYPHR